MDSKAMRTLSYGLFVLTAKEGEKLNGCITNTAIQVTTEPNQIAFAVNRANYTHDMLKNTGKFVISVISEKADFELFKHFGFQTGREVDKFAGYDKYGLTAAGLPYITEGTNAWIEGEVISAQDLGTHTLFVCKVTDMEVLSDDASATYVYYHNNIKPKPEETGKTAAGKTIWRCTICGYEYEGEELPADFVCPLCKHPASDFEKVTG